MQTLSLKLFGDIRLSHGQNDDIALPRKTQILLAYLASEAGKQFPRGKLASLIWQDRMEEQARHSLRQCLFALAKSIGDGSPLLLNADRHQVSLNTDTVEVDTWRFEKLLAGNSPDAMRAAVALYDDDFLANIGYENEILDIWCASERTKYRELCYETLGKLSSHYADIANLDEAIEFGRRLVTLDPLREDGHRTLIRHFYRAGRRAEALRQYRTCVDTLRHELNVEPEAATVNLYAEISGRGNQTQQYPAAAAEQHDDPPIRYDLPAKSEKVIIDRKLVVLFTGLIVFLLITTVASWLSME